jgi:signal transduction histidine kinase
MSSDRIVLLLIEDNPGDVRLIQEFLTEAKGFQLNLEVANSLSEGCEYLATKNVDIILLDLSLPDSSGLDTLLRVQVAAPNKPVVVLTGFLDDELGLEAVSRGAQDYLVKGQVDGSLILRSIRYAIERQRMDYDLRRRTEELSRLYEASKQLEEELKARTQDLEAANQELERANDHLRALSRVKDEFVSNVSHELRTPITNLKLHNYLVTAQPYQMTEHLEVLRRETDRLEQLIEGLLTLSRLDQNQVPFWATSTDLNSIVEEYVTDRVSLAESRGLKLMLTPQPDLPPVKADPKLVGQVLSILLTNALNYTPTGGQVVVNTQRFSDPARPWVGFSVRDNGPGIPQDEQKQLFSRFFRGTVGRESGVAGTGLGLAIAKEIVDKHSGRIEVSSKGIPGQGTTFRVWLPAMEVAF